MKYTAEVMEWRCKKIDSFTKRVLPSWNYYDKEKVLWISMQNTFQLVITLSIKKCHQLFCWMVWKSKYLPFIYSSSILKSRKFYPSHRKDQKCIENGWNLASDVKRWMEMTMMWTMVMSNVKRLLKWWWSRRLVHCQGGGYCVSDTSTTTTVLSPFLSWLPSSSSSSSSSG